MLTCHRWKNLLNCANVELLRVGRDDVEQECGVDAAGNDELEHHRSLNVREALVLLCRRRWTKSSQISSGTENTKAPQYSLRVCSFRK